MSTGESQVIYVQLICANGHQYIGPSDAPDRKEACPSCGTLFHNGDPIFNGGESTTTNSDGSPSERND